MKGPVHKDDFYSAQCIATHESEVEENMDAKNNYLHRWLLPFTGLKGVAPYAGRSVSNIPEFMP